MLLLCDWASSSSSSIFLSYPALLYKEPYCSQTTKHAQSANDSGYTELRSGSGIISQNSSDESYHNVTAKSEIIV